MPGFWAIALPLSSSQGGDEICPSDKGNKSWKSLPKLQGQHFLFSGSFNFKRKKKKSQPLLTPHAVPSPLSGLRASVEGQPDKKPLLGSDHLCFSSLPASAPLYCIFFLEIQAENVSISIFNKEAGGERKATQESWRRGRSPNALTVKTPFLESERAQDGGSRRRTREVVVLGEAFRLI